MSVSPVVPPPAPVRGSYANCGDCGNKGGRGGEGRGGGGRREPGGCRIARNFCKVPGARSPPGRAGRGGGSAGSRTALRNRPAGTTQKKPKPKPKNPKHQNKNTQSPRKTKTKTQQSPPNGGQQLAAAFILFRVPNGCKFILAIKKKVGANRLSPVKFLTYSLYLSMIRDAS